MELHSLFVPSLIDGFETAAYHALQAFNQVSRSNGNRAMLRQGS